MKFRTLAATCVLFSLFWSDFAAAQFASFARQLARTGLVQEDINIMVEAGSELYASRNAVVGNDTIWSNPSTGAYGLVEITSVEGDCVGLVYKFRTTRRNTTQTVQLRRCLIDGRWILSP